jgi:uridine phosphorylase
MNDPGHDGIIMHPVRARREKKVPATGFLFVNPTEARYAVSRVVSEGGSKRFLFNSTLCVNEGGTFFVAGPSVGAPMAVMTMEKLIVLGAERIVLVGWCGGLQQNLTVGDIVLPGQALCGEGTSHYYSQDQEPKPSGSVVAWLRAALSRKEMAWEEGRVWSTDAPYRESRPLLASLRDNWKISAIDMEYSALCTVALFRGIEFAACMLVSDELWRQEWRPGFSAPSFQIRSQQLSSLLLDSAAPGAPM